MDADAPLATDPRIGLTEEEAARRLERWGPNDLEAAEALSPWRILWRQLTDLMMLIIIAAMGVSLVTWALEGARGVPADALVIGAIVVLNAVLGFVQEHSAERSLQELKRITTALSLVLRDGAVRRIDRSALVPGDVVLLHEGDRVPADLTIVAADALEADESLLTGESLPVHKRPDDAAYAGTSVTAGEGRGIVTATGMRTELGGIALTLAATESEATPLERRLDRLGAQIGWGVLAISIIVGATFLVAEGRVDAATVTRVLMFSVALAVAAVPEGLPAVLTISLSIGARRLAARKAVVRRLSAVETLGSVTTIVTDKTGTLTRNEVSVERVFCDGGDTRQGPAWDLLLEAAVLANAADLEGTRALGDPSEAALLTLAEREGLDWRALRRDTPCLARAPFTSERGRASVACERHGRPWLLAKGSLDALEARATSWLSQGRVLPLDAAARARFREAEEAFAGDGLRTMAMAAREVPGAPSEQPADEERDLVLLGLVGMGDPPRREVPAALERCRKAGIRVIMLTGDHPRTALAIARQVGLTTRERALTGPEVEAMDESMLRRAVAECDIFARVSPRAKLRLVEALLAAGDVVAMTGDGVNDAPALKKVHCGVAMGSGTAVAVEASDMVLLDDNFATIVAAIEGGRAVYANIQRFIGFLFSGNLGVVIAMFLGTLLAGLLDMRWQGQLLLPLTAVQILWMNLVTDGAPAVAFSLGRVRTESLDSGPRRIDEPIVSPSMWRLVFAVGSWIALTFLVVLDLGWTGGLLTAAGATTPDAARTAGFYLIVTTRLWNALTFHALPRAPLQPRVLRELYVPLACLLSWGLTVALLAFPWSRELFGLCPLGGWELLGLTLLAPLVVGVGDAARRMGRVRLRNTSSIG